MLKLLHTSDWHLGVSADSAPREEEHRLFLDWLLELIDTRKIDVLLHAGDAFHHAQPSARSMTMYYEFLARCAKTTSLRQVVITGGNHDSPSRLDAPQSLLQSLDIHVVGGLAADPATWDRCLCPITHPAGGHVQAVVLAVPYVHESRLGVQTSGLNPLDIRQGLTDRFRTLYATLCDRAEALYPHVPLLAMGHLTCYPDGVGQVEGAYHTPIHLVEMLGSLPPQIFDLRTCYVALGHIHQPMEIAAVNAWYAGSPVPTDIIESRTARTVLEVEVDPERPRSLALVQRIEVPQWRRIFELEGPPDQIFDQLPRLEWSESLRPYLYVDMHVQAPMPEAMLKLEEVLAGFEKERRPRVIRYKETLQNPTLKPGELDLSPVPLSEMSPREVFMKLYQLKHQSDPTPAHMAAFETLLQRPQDDA